MKKIAVLLLTIIILTLTLSACQPKEDDDSAEQITYSEGLQFILNDDENDYGYVLRGLGTCTDKHVIIPPTYEGIPVIAISMFAFANCDFVESITMPNSITKMGSDVFRGCSSLKKIKLSSSLLAITPSAFEGCSSLESIIIPKSVIEIYGNSFKDCTSLKTVIFQDPYNWGFQKFEYNPQLDQYELIVIPINENLSDSKVAANLLTSIYCNYTWRKIEK